MAVKTSLIAEGVVVRVSERSVTVKATGEVLTFVNALIVGDVCMVEAQISRDIEPPKKGQEVRCRISVGVYRDDDQTVIEEWLD